MRVAEENRGRIVSLSTTAQKNVKLARWDRLKIFGLRISEAQ